MFLGKQYFIASPECASCNLGAEFGKLTTYYLHSISHKFRQKEDSIRHCLVTNVISCGMYIAVASLQIQYIKSAHRYIWQQLPFLNFPSATSSGN